MKFDFSSGLVVESTYRQFITLDRDSLVEIITVFLSEAQYNMDTIESLIKNGSPDELRQQIHKFKGSCGLAGAGMMFGILEQMDEICKSGEISSATRAQIKTYFLSLKDYWKKTQVVFQKLYLL